MYSFIYLRFFWQDQSSIRKLIEEMVDILMRGDTASVLSVSSETQAHTQAQRNF